MNQESWRFVVDTDTYSGNFERPMCAYMTGKIGDCEVGSAAAEVFHEEVSGDPFESRIIQNCEDGCYRPVQTWPTPGWFNNGLGKHYREEEYHSQNRWPAHQSILIEFDSPLTQEEIELLCSRAKRFAEIWNDGDPERFCEKFESKDNINVTQCRVIHSYVVEEEKVVFSV